MTQTERPLSTLYEIQQALFDLPRLTRNELERIRCSLQHLTGHERDRYFSELFFLLTDNLLSVHGALTENRIAIQHFDKSSQRLSRWLIGLTIVLVLLTIVITGLTIALVFKK